MSFYYTIAQAVAGKFGLDAYEVESFLRESVAPRYALHVWSVDDVKHSARENGWPMSDALAREIIAVVDSHVDSEFGITHDTIKTAIEDSFADMSAEDLLAQAKDLRGGFVVVSSVLTPDSGVLWRGVTSLAEATQKARELAAEHGEVVLASASYGAGEVEVASVDLLRDDFLDTCVAANVNGLLLFVARDSEVMAEKC